MNENDLMNRLVASKAIMDATNTMKRGESRNINIPSAMSEDFDIPQARYNIPQEFLQESPQPYLSSIPKENTKPVGVPSVDAIKNSKLPDEIKRLMIEHPIAQAEQPQITLSNELVEKASRLMKRNDSTYKPESAQPQTKSVKTESTLDYKRIQQMINEAIENAFRTNGLMLESTEKTNEMFSFRVGKHLFEGKITKVKKVS